MKITLTAAQAATLGKAIAPAVSTDKTRLHLTLVHVETTDDSATFTATDGYRMHRITAPQTTGETGDKFLVAGVEFVAALGNAAKAIGKGAGFVVVEYDNDGTVEVTGGGVTHSVRELDIDFPPCGSIMDAEPETESESAYFHGPYMADLITAASTVSGKVKKGCHDAVGMVQIQNLNSRKPMHVRSSSPDTGMTFHGLLMPQRFK